MIPAQQRQNLLSLIDQAVAEGARREKACEVVGITARCLQRWRSTPTPGDLVDGRSSRIQNPANALSSQERQAVYAAINDPANAHLSPSQIVPRLADAGVYIASEATFCRLLRAQDMDVHRRPERAPREQQQRPLALAARAPNEVVCWDISCLPTTMRACHYYLYLVIDLYSRCIVAWQVHDVECAEHASALMRDYAWEHQITPQQVCLHSDNGAVMRAGKLVATLQALGIARSYSRPAVSNDNPYVESVLHTLKYRPDLRLVPFASLDEARAWVAAVVNWYNHEHRHSGIRYVTPRQRHEGKDGEILARRAAVYAAARARNPQRWSGKTRNWQPVEVVHLNPREPEDASTAAEPPLVKGAQRRSEPLTSRKAVA